MNKGRSLGLDLKALGRRHGKREADRMVADALTWDRLTKLGLTPIHTPRPSAWGTK